MAVIEEIRTSSAGPPRKQSRAEKRAGYTNRMKQGHSMLRTVGKEAGRFVRSKAWGALWGAVGSINPQAYTAAQVIGHAGNVAAGGSEDFEIPDFRQFAQTGANNAWMMGHVEPTQMSQSGIGQPTSSQNKGPNAFRVESSSMSYMTPRNARNYGAESFNRQLFMPTAGTNFRNLSLGAGDFGDTNEYAGAPAFWDGGGGGNGSFESSYYSGAGDYHGGAPMMGRPGGWSQQGPRPAPASSYNPEYLQQLYQDYSNYSDDYGPDYNWSY